MTLRKASPLAKQVRENRKRRQQQEQERHARNEKVLAGLRKEGGRTA